MRRYSSLAAAVLCLGCGSNAPSETEQSSPSDTTQDTGETEAPTAEPGPQPPADQPEPVDVIEPSDEICGNGADDNGDEHVDEGCACDSGEVQRCYPFDILHAGIGACAWGTQSCDQQVGSGESAYFTWGACEGAVRYSEEACNGTDDDCDGAIDDGCGCVEGEASSCTTICGSGQQTCTGGEWGPCNAPLPQPETCDGIDNDCNGVVDDGLARACTTTCGSGTETCTNGAWSGCDAPVQQTETCDGIDNDCDGTTDEGVCSCGLQVDAPTILPCTAAGNTHSFVITVSNQASVPVVDGVLQISSSTPGHWQGSDQTVVLGAWESKSFTVTYAPTDPSMQGNDDASVRVVASCGGSGSVVIEASNTPPACIP